MHRTPLPSNGHQCQNFNNTEIERTCSVFIAGWSSICPSSLITDIFNALHSLSFQCQPDSNEESILIKIPVNSIKILFKNNNNIQRYQCSVIIRTSINTHCSQCTSGITRDMINGHVLNYFITASTFKIQFWKQLIQNRLVFGQDCDTHTQKCQHLWHRNLSAPSTGRISHNIDILHPLSFSFLLLSPVLSRAIKIVQTKQKKLFFLTFHLKLILLIFPK